MSSTSSITNQNEQVIATQANGSSVLSYETVHNSTVSSPTPTLPGQTLTDADHEDNLMERIDELIQIFFKSTQPTTSLS
jgi:hypothetical protein